MLPADHLVREGFELKSDTMKFLKDILLVLLNQLINSGIDSTNCKLIGNNDISVLRGEKTIVVFFSRSKVTFTPVYAEYPFSLVVKSKEPIIEKAEYFMTEDIQQHDDLKTFKQPVGVIFPISYFQLTDKKLSEAHNEVANLLIKLAQEDFEQQKRIVRVNPIFHGRNFLIESDLCFVLMSFKEPYNEIYNKIIKPTVEKEGFRCVKSDDIFSTSAVIEDIWENINKASLIIAEISDNNANVMYELGICHTIGKNVMMITQNPESIPFNFRHIRTYSYKNEIASSEELKKNISSMIQYTKSIQ